MKKTHDYVHDYRGYWSEGGEEEEMVKDYVPICIQIVEEPRSGVRITRRRH